jgi:DnaJ family protein C protein 8
LASEGLEKVLASSEGRLEWRMAIGGVLVGANEVPLNEAIKVSDLHISHPGTRHPTSIRKSTIATRLNISHPLSTSLTLHHIFLVMAPVNTNTNTNANAPEVDRVLRAFHRNPYDVLDLPAFAPTPDVKKTFRRKSLQIHPDKNPHPRATEAFKALNNAQDDLLGAKRAGIDATIERAVALVLQAHGRKSGEEHLIPDFQVRLRAQARLLMTVAPMVSQRPTETAQRSDTADTSEAPRPPRHVFEELRKCRAEADKARDRARERRRGNWASFRDLKERKAQKAMTLRQRASTLG